MTEMLALNENWLSAGNTVANYLPATSSVLTVGNVTGLTGGTYYYQPCTWTYPVYVDSPARPIKLALSEVERLRKAAKADPKLKAILSKFTSQIEITVDFE